MLMTLDHTHTETLQDAHGHMKEGAAGHSRTHRWAISIQDSVEDANVQVRVPGIHNVLLQMRQQGHQLLRIPATCYNV